MRLPAGQQAAARKGPAGWFPRSLPNRSTGSAPSYAPAASPRLRRRPSPWPPDRRHHPAREFPDRPRSWPCRSGARCNPAQIRQVGAGGSLEGRSAAGSSRTPFRLAGRTRAIWRCRPVPSLSGLLPLSSASPESSCPQLHRPAATDRPRCPLTTARFRSASWRSMSVSQTAFGAAALNWRSTRSSCTGGPALRVRPRFSGVDRPDPLLGTQPGDPVLPGR